jgi:hypothetical protein
MFTVFTQTQNDPSSLEITDVAENTQTECVEISCVITTKAPLS